MGQTKELFQIHKDEEYQEQSKKRNQEIEDFLDQTEGTGKTITPHNASKVRIIMAVHRIEELDNIKNKLAEVQTND